MAAIPAVRRRPDARRRAGRLHRDARRRRGGACCGRSRPPGLPDAGRRRRAVRARRHVSRRCRSRTRRSRARWTSCSRSPASVGAHVAIANDPDADRLGAAIPQPDGSWRRLGGDEIGWLFADYLLASTSGDDRLVVTTLVSSALLSKMAAAHNVHSAETFTGFKWIARAVLDHPEWQFVFGYEQALGYLVAEPAARQGRHLGRRAVRRDRRRRRTPTGARCRAGSTTSPPGSGATSSPTRRSG